MEQAQNKISGSAIMERLDRIVESVAPLALQHSPRPLIVYKPNLRDVSKGVAGKFSYRTVPVTTDSGYVNYVTSFFVELVPQIASTDKFARFGWRNEQGNEAHPEAVSAKLGLPDISALLLGYREYRLLGRDVPVGIRPISKNPESGKYEPVKDTNAIGLVHKFEDTVTMIRWIFSPERSILEISRGRSQRKSISLSLQEEIQLMAFLNLAMETMLVTS